MQTANTLAKEASGDVDVDLLSAKYPYVRHAKIFKLHTSKSKEVYTSQNFALTERLLIDVALKSAELESEGLEEVPVTELTFVNEIMAESESIYCGEC